MDTSTVKVTPGFAATWPAKHGDIPNAYVKADKENDLEILLHVSSGMDINDELQKKLGATNANKVALDLKKSLYGLKQAGRLWNQLLHASLSDAGFTQCISDICLYFKRNEKDLTAAGVYVNISLVTATGAAAVERGFISIALLSNKNLGSVSKFLGTRVMARDVHTYAPD
ncbi:FOG: Transposon-encoded proteins with TYA, reverse transcriptase, integrase domains in various combinations [Plasmopara halstedii]|uniref:FOG: Transposon-encoded proteins with TYA, reverse transcriptase, integrase domains in various combinations n=1 Tax=Plasmopara halstedii TaxID=4781 RepID=A0A0P1AHU2_PLAHL|nr:FOG: Transposon-encoded proteins with TYA, reverse transcriptase, integrase domains in various combinations [Plasmopara halstedii]CEG40734.1 FOG: Transposon-encoded proteins with TYA, reverse transcriptase, integrase domains in various combinations [Plasmopara halstedii]|eukprot:XP_024577103.1 FOG: Transposon-encoded proteins with TYA, reverse transcriptase, integrase domains in various combinations [Plasmopara halstedii]